MSEKLFIWFPSQTLRSQWAVWSGSACYGQWVGTGATLKGEEGASLWRSGDGQEAGMSINTVGTQKAFSEGGEPRKGSASRPVYWRRKTLEVTHVGSFYSFLPIMCRAGSEQAGVLFSCSEAQWTGAAFQQRPAWGSARGAGQESWVPGSGAGLGEGGSSSSGMFRSFHARCPSAWCQRGRWGAAREAAAWKEGAGPRCLECRWGELHGTTAWETHRTFFVPPAAACQGTFHDYI